MTLKHHQIPTHLNVEDRAFYGLSARQFMYLTSGFAGSYGLFNQWPNLALALRLGLAIVCFAVSVALALIRPHGRGLEEWAFVVLHYAATPKRSIWRLAEPETTAWRPAISAWMEMAPQLAWKEEPR